MSAEHEDFNTRAQGGPGRPEGLVAVVDAAARGRADGLLKVLPFAMMAGVGLAELLTDSGVGLLPLLALGPAFASVACEIRTTALIGTIAVTLCLLLGVYNDSLGTVRTNVTLGAIVGVTVASALASAGRMRYERRLADVTSVAEAAQRVLLRPVPRRAGPGIGMAVSYTSAAAEARIGGDLYEVVTRPTGGVRIIVGDVQGKGLEAVETAAVVLGAFREAAHDEAELPGVVARLEKALARHLSGEQFVTVVLAEVIDEKEIAMVNCGHPGPLVLTGDGAHFLAEPPEEAPPLGLLSLEPEPPVPYRVPFAPGDQILFYTDGVIEARDPFQRFYPLTARTHLLEGPDPQAALDALRADLLRHVGRPLGDDAAMLLLRRRTPS
ncbi:Serine phosphatase RsbU, regulator of sigma subunit [Sinosporangium album]|uniref:Serine phosphatase RsbU, regulator of sigma subunit n=1 Tax=Sinosporangium album TaxID=504805 RepID=A0A1G7XGI8_9ACTN|nr:Serine phosphatase RsbU, regulator of sigma subunit [Sinosporangium album]